MVAYHASASSREKRMLIPAHSVGHPMRFSKDLGSADSWHNIASSMLLPHLLDIPQWHVDLFMLLSSIASTLGGGG